MMLVLPLLLLGWLARCAIARQCAAFDVAGNAYVFGTPSGDFRLGTLNATTGTSTSITNVNGRPPFDGNGTQCFVGQYTNALYVLGGSSTNPANAYIFDFAKQSWSTQKTSGGKDANSYTAILDHDTLTLYAYSNGSIDALVFPDSSPAGSGDTIAWMNGAANNNPAFSATDYQPVLGAANNHIHFLNTPNAKPGDVYIFVIHFAYNQPEVQSLGNFPTVHGQTVSLLSNTSSSPPTFAFFPDGGSNSYLVNVVSNTTLAYPAPPTTDASARYGASQNRLLQVTVDGQASYLDLSNPAGGWRNVTIPTTSNNSSSSSASNSTASIKSEKGSTSGIAGAAATLSPAGNGKNAAIHNVPLETIWIAVAGACALYIHSVI